MSQKKNKKSNGELIGLAKSLDSGKHYFPLPNELFSLGLESTEIAIYSYLKSLENRETHECWPSYKKIAEAVGVCENTVAKYVKTLEEKRLIETEPTEVILKTGEKRNGNLKYRILPIRFAIDHYNNLAVQEARSGQKNRKRNAMLAEAFQDDKVS